MAVTVDLRPLIDDLERRRPDIKGKTIAQVPELAAFRYKYRRSFYHWAELHFVMAVVNLTLALSPFPFWWLNTLGAAVSITTMFFSEGRARTMTRQLKRPASEQVARDLVGLRD